MIEPARPIEPADFSDPASFIEGDWHALTAMLRLATDPPPLPPELQAEYDRAREALVEARRVGERAAWDLWIGG